MEEALHELAFTKSILGHLQVPPKHEGPMSEAFRVMVGVLKNRLRSNVHAMSNVFQMCIRGAVALEAAPLNGPAHASAFTHLHSSKSLGLYREDQAERLEVYNNVKSFYWNCAKAFPILIPMPWLSSAIHWSCSNGLGVSRKKGLNLLLWITRQAFDGKDEKPGAYHAMNGGDDQASRRHCNRQDHPWSSVRECIAGPLDCAVLFYNFCEHLEYHERLRVEAVECKDASFGSLNQEIPFLDNFVNETARLSPGPLFHYSQRSSHSHGPIHVSWWLSYPGWQLTGHTTTIAYAR
ncbi:hypothetical protein JMJ35_002968 [Cladonia borealis]|uniref:Uncharacterized protein n=1 Tax=Cladonia borealis TaxID=184061 RepID=A0AA39R5D1_9LECA|nr:hypothetical protein JMJ35_002968 [Cladonia borealis]